MAETQFGDYKIVRGTDTEVLTAMRDDGVAKADVLGFHQVDSTTAAVLYEF